MLLVAVVEVVEEGKALQLRHGETCEIWVLLRGGTQSPSIFKESRSFRNRDIAVTVVTQPISRQCGARADSGIDVFTMILNNIP